jgi:hypothetical protein
MRAFEIINEDPVLKQRVIKGLSKKSDSDPIFPQVYKTLIGDPLSGRIKNYIEQRGDPDARSALDYLDKLIPTLGSTEEVKKFLSKFKDKDSSGKPYDFIKIEKAFPKQGMSSAAALSDIVEDGFAKKLFDSLTSYTGKNDAGPGEAALAIMSPNITYAQGATTDEFGKGGDIIVNGVGKVEVKGGTGGRLVAAVQVDQKGMSAVLGKYANANITPNTMSKPLPEDFPKEQFVRAACQAFFNEERAELISAAGTPAFRRLWLNSIYDAYQTYAGWAGVLIITKNSYQYTVSGSQLPDSNIKDWGYLYYPGIKQVRSFFPQILPKV